ncbi:MAG: DUF3870 domain-containing protein [Dehalococcoidia bacterium]|jgi:hypothetical protein
MSDATGGINNEPRLIFVGHARLPQSLAPGDAPIVLVELEIEGEDALVTAVEVSSPLPAANRLLTRLLLGRSLQTGYDDAVGEFQRQYMGPPQKAICTALNNAYDLYRLHLRRSRLKPFFSGRLIGERGTRLGLNREGPF